jgi:TetR/AcrR family transcriptional regulator, transcriptional repressor of aconitase
VPNWNLVRCSNILTLTEGECLLTSMSTLRMTSDLRRQLILGAAKRCFARNGFAGTTTRSVAAAAAISEGLLFKHFPSKAALYAEILAEECEADPELHRLLGLVPSTETLVTLIRMMVRHFQEVADAPEQEDAQRLRLMISSHLDDGEFARLIYEKIGGLIGPVFAASLERAIEAGDASRIGREPRNLFWFAHHTVLMATMARLPSVPCLNYGSAAELERQLCEFILRGIGLSQAAIATHLDREWSPGQAQPVTAESA